MNQQLLPCAKATKPYQAEMQWSWHLAPRNCSMNVLNSAKTGPSYLSRKVSKSSNWEVWGSVERWKFVAYRLLCRHVREVLAIRISFICWILEVFSIPFLYKSARNQP